MLERATRFGLALGVVTSIGCTRPNPAFDEYDVTVGEASESSSSQTGPGTESSSASASTSETSTTSEEETETETETTAETETSEGESEETETETTETDTDEPLCEAPEFYADCDGDQNGLPGSPWRALGIDCPGDDLDTIPGEGTLAAEDPNSWRVATAFGTAPGPNFGAKLWAAREDVVVSGGPDQPDVAPNTSSAILMLSTGVLPPPNLDGEVILEPGAQGTFLGNQNPDAPMFPGPAVPINPELGSNGGLGGTPFVDCKPGLDCSDSLYETWVLDGHSVFHDKIWLQFTVTPPEGVHSFLLDLAFLTSEYPAFVNAPQYNDTFVVWASSESFTGNLAFIDGEPLSGTTLFEADAIDFEDEDPALNGTGFEGHGGSSWMHILGPAEPFSDIELTLFLADLGDASRASVVLLDNFRWRCGDCGPDTCGLDY